MNDTQAQVKSNAIGLVLSIYIAPWSVLQFEPPKKHFLLKVDGAQAVHHPQDTAAVEVENVMEEHWIPVKEELVVVNIVIITERQPLRRIVTEGKGSDPALWVAQDQVLRDVEHLSTHVEVDDV